MTKNILIAEDDEDIVGLLRLYLEKDGYEIISVDNGEDAFKIVKSKQISLAILDIMMPKMNGYELTKKIREITKIPIIICECRVIFRFFIFFFFQNLRKSFFKDYLKAY